MVSMSELSLMPFICLLLALYAVLVQSPYNDFQAEIDPYCDMYTMYTQNTIVLHYVIEHMYHYVLHYVIDHTC